MSKSKKSKPPYTLAKWARVAFSTPNAESHFFGYYNYSPLSAGGRYLLAHKVLFDGREIAASDQAEVGYFDRDTCSWHSVGVTRAFNWQQGSMLQWLGPDYKSRIIYNDQEGSAFVARIFCLDSGLTRTIPHAVYAVHPSGQKALGLKFERHYFCRAYHYEGIRDERWNVPLHPEDGIDAIDLETGAVRLLLRTADIANTIYPPLEGRFHWLEHLMWNREGSRFSFFHRYSSSSGHITRVFTADSKGGALFELGMHNEYTFSHLGWRFNESFVVSALKTKPIARAYATMVGSTNVLKRSVVVAWRIAKRFFPRELAERQRELGGYALVRDGQQVEGWFNTGILRRDGHPSWTQDGRFMLTDTYADETGYRSLLLYDAVNDRLHVVGRFLSPFNDCSYRADLHPRFSHDDSEIVIDTAHGGRHNIYIIKIDWSKISPTVNTPC